MLLRVRVALLCLCGQQQRAAATGAAATPSSGITVGRLPLKLAPATQTAAGLGLSGAAGADGFSFTKAQGHVGLGDASIRARPAGAGAGWSAWRSAGASPLGSTVCSKLPCRANLTLVGGPAAPTFTMVREWERGPNATLRLVVKVTNTGADPLEIGGLGLAMPFAWSAGTAAGDLASTFADPAITGEHGYVSVTRLSGKREVLMITTGRDEAWCQAGKEGWCRTSLEAWDTPAKVGAGAALAAGGRAAAAAGGPDNGAKEWLCHTKAYAADWANASKAWLPPTSITMAPGQAKDYVLLFSVADDLRSKDAALSAADTALVHGIPGYILGTVSRRSYRWHLGCALLKTPAISLLTGHDHGASDGAAGAGAQAA